jgi:thiamine pyrophosphate-dependent acetolactate synthase large subunit-like protein
VPSRLGPDPDALAKAADMIAAAEHPVIITEYTGRDHEAFYTLVELAETAGIPVYDINSRLSFPSRHPLNASMSKDAFREADLVVCLDARDWEKPTTELVSTTRELTSVVPAGAKWVEIGFGDLELSSWALDYQRMNHADLRVMADTTLAIPMLTTLLKARVDTDRKLAAKVKARTAAIAAKTKARRAKWAEQAKEGWGREPDHAAAPSPPRSGTRSRARTGCSRRIRSRTGRASSGISTSRIAIPGSPSARPPRSASRSASRSRTARRSGWWWTCSRMATSCSTRAPCGSRRSTASPCSS